MTGNVVLCEVREGVATLTLNRPEARNAIDLQVVKTMTALLDELAAREDVHALVLTGAGGKAFASGSDIAQLLERERDDAFQGINTNLFRKVEDFPHPTIAAIVGYCLGGGLELAMACDLRVAGTSGKFGQPEVSLGIMPAGGATYRLPRLVGLGKAKELIFTGDIIDAVEALRIGLVEKVAPDEHVLAEAHALAVRIAAHDPLALRVAKLACNTIARSGGDAGLGLETLGQAILFDSPAKRARMTAFLNRRK